LFYFLKNKIFFINYKIINDKSINKILATETAEPAIIVIGITENKIKK
jgi:hypothetical protein